MEGETPALMVTSMSSNVFELSSHDEEQLLQTNHQLLMALFDMHDDNDDSNGPSKQKLSDYVRKFYVVNDFKTQSISDEFCHNVSYLCRQQSLTSVTLQAFSDSFRMKLGAIRTWKKVSTVSFTVAAALASAAAAATNTKEPVAVAAAAAAANVMFGTVGRGINSRMKKRESAVKKQMEIIGDMIVNTEMVIEDLKDIRVLAKICLQLENGCSSENDDDDDDEVVVGKREESFEKLKGKAEDYKRDMNWAREVVLKRLTN